MPTDERPTLPSHVHRADRTGSRSCAVCVFLLAAFSGDTRAQTGVAFVQQNWAAPQTPSSAVTVTYTAAQTAGNLNVMVVAWNDAAAQVQSVTDTRGNTYELAVGPTALTNGLLRTTALTRSMDVFKYPGATLAISASGISDGILWAIQRNGDCGVQLSCGSAAPGVLKAYDASNLGTLLYSSDQMGARDQFDFASKFSVPLVANGKVFVTSIGRLTVYGLLP